MNAPQFQQIQKQTQGLALTPQLRQSLKVLQSPILELRALLRQNLQQNPLLEEVEEVFPEKPSAELETGDEAPYDSPSAADPEELEKRRQRLLDNLVAPQGSLREHLLEQALLLNLDPLQKGALIYLIDSLNDRGLLSGKLEELAQAGDLDLSAAQEALKQLQSFDPPGIGARDLQECLLLQLERAGRGDSLAGRIVRSHFAQLPQRKVTEIAREEKTTPEAVERALAEIGRLNPSPGRAFTQAPEPIISADLIFYKQHGEWKVRLNEDALPKLRLSMAYKDMLGRENLNARDRDYLIGQIREGRALLDAIAQRRRTLENIGRVLLRRQHDFFEQGPEALKPLTMAQIAEEIGMHEATVSRAVADKFADTPWGFFELRRFFTHGYETRDGEAAAVEAVKERIGAHIRNEDARHPLSDQAIAEILAGEGIQIARRTVAKYRESLEIPTAQLRKRFS